MRNEHKIFPYRDVGERLKLLRGSRPQSKIAERLSISTRLYQYYESGERLPTISSIVTLATMFDVTVAWILHGTKDHESDWEKYYSSIEIEREIRRIENAVRSENRTYYPKEREFLEMAHLLRSLQDDRQTERERRKSENRPVESMKRWLTDFWISASPDEKVWLTIHFKKSFPEYEKWYAEAEQPEDERRIAKAGLSLPVKVLIHSESNSDAFLSVIVKAVSEHPGVLVADVRARFPKLNEQIILDLIEIAEERGQIRRVDDEGIIKLYPVQLADRETDHHQKQ